MEHTDENLSYFQIYITDVPKTNELRLLKKVKYSMCKHILHC